MGPGQLGPGAQFATFWRRTVGPRTTGPRGPTVRGPICHFLGADSWAPDNWAPGPNCPGPNLPGPNCPGPNCPGPNLPRTLFPLTVSRLKAPVHLVRFPNPLLLENLSTVDWDTIYKVDWDTRFQSDGTYCTHTAPTQYGASRELMECSSKHCTLQYYFRFQFCSNIELHWC